MGNAQRCSPAAPAPRPAPAMEVLAGRPFSAPRPARRGAMAAAAAELEGTGTPKPAATPPPRARAASSRHSALSHRACPALARRASAMAAGDARWSSGRTPPRRARHGRQIRPSSSGPAME